MAFKVLLVHCISPCCLSEALCCLKAQVLPPEVMQALKAAGGLDFCWP